MKPQVISIPLEDATAEQVRGYVTGFLNLDLPAEASEADLRAALAAAQPGVTMIFTFKEEDRAPAPPSAFQEGAAGEAPLKPEEQAGRTAGTLGRSDPRAIIHIPIIETEDNSGNHPVFVGVNGRGWQLTRGVDLNVPWRVVEALKNARQKIVRHDMREGHEGEVIERMADRVPFNFVQQPSAAEIDAWMKSTQDQFCA